MILSERHFWIFMLWGVLIPISPITGEKIWKCSGKPTTYTYTDCETDGSVTEGCYYLVHFEQYRPCNDICDGVERWSIDEERCRSYCSGYLDRFCKVKSKHHMPSAPMTRLPTTTRKQIHSSTMALGMATPSTDLDPLTAIVAIGVTVAVVLLIAVASTILVLNQRKRRSSKNGIYYTTPNEEAYLEKKKCGSDVQPQQAVMDNNANKKVELFLVQENAPLAMDVD